MASNGEKWQLSNQPLRNVTRISVPAQELTNQDVQNQRDRVSKYANVCWHLSLVMLICTMLVALIWTVSISMDYYNCSPEKRFERMRLDFAYREKRHSVGGRTLLSCIEKSANKQLMVMKLSDRTIRSVWNDYPNGTQFLNSYKVNNTDLYSTLRDMPKGGLLHIHAEGMFDVDRIGEIIAYPHLWTCISANGTFEDFRFAKKMPNMKPPADAECDWMPMKNLRRSPKTFRQLRKSLTINSHDIESADQLAKHMKRAYRLIHGLITYRPIWPTFLMRMLNDIYADGVQYIELRSSLPVMYDLAGNNYTIFDTARSLVTAAHAFHSNHFDFIALKLIYAPERESSFHNITHYIDNARRLKVLFPGLFIGFDLINFGNECELDPLGTTTHLVHVKDIDYYFHAGESHCLNLTTNMPDANLIDALLLGSKRIANPLILPKHPDVQRAMKLLRIAAEICPLSNHYMQNVNNFNMHPGANLLAGGYPVVIGSDYPYFWNATPLTDDFYMTFVAMARWDTNLRLLKQLAVNSILYSGMRDDEKRKALHKWNIKWNIWIEKFMRNCY